MRVHKFVPVRLPLFASMIEISAVEIKLRTVAIPSLHLYEYVSRILVDKSTACYVVIYNNTDEWL